MESGTMIKKMDRGPFGIIVHKKSMQGSGEMVKDMVQEHIIMHTEIFTMVSGNVD